MIPQSMYFQLLTEMPFVDGYGLPFNPQNHLDYIQIGVAALTLPSPPLVHTEPVWKDRAAGFHHCTVLHEDHEQGKGHYA